MAVLRVSNSGQRTAIENYTLNQTFPDIIVFLQDGNGDWITSTETLADVKYNREAHVANVIQRLTQHGEVIDYVPPPL